MFLEKRTKLVIAVGLVLLIAASATSRPRRTQRLSTGSWGGPHIRIQVDEGSATIDYDCAHGTIAGPLTFDSKGRFTWRGTHTREGFGPIREGPEGNDRAAIYTGIVKGETLTLTVKLATTKEVVSTFTVTRGGAGRIFKCK